jgi:hypothetical protein
MTTKDLTDSIVRPLQGPGRQIQLGIEPTDIQKIELSISDPRLDDYLAGVGVQLLCLCPTAGIKTGVAFEIPGRNAYAVKVGVYMTQSRWPGATEYALLIVPDTEQTPVLPPEYVQMLSPKELVRFQVVAGL